MIMKDVITSKERLYFKRSKIEIAIRLLAVVILASLVIGGLHV